MSAQHTPGPWTVQTLWHSFRVVDSRAMTFSNSRLCDVQHWSTSNRGPSREEAEANARLIAAAPDLLDALKDLERVSGSAMLIDDPARANARAAIAKALGEKI